MILKDYLPFGKKAYFQRLFAVSFSGWVSLSTPNKPLINFQMGQDQEPELRVQKYSFFLSGNSGFLHVLWGCKANVKLEALCLGLKTRKFSHGLLWFVERQFFSPTYSWFFLITSFQVFPCDKNESSVVGLHKTPGDP